MYGAVAGIKPARLARADFKSPAPTDFTTPDETLCALVTTRPGGFAHLRSLRITPEQRSVIIVEIGAVYEHKRAGAHLWSLRGNDL